MAIQFKHNTFFKLERLITVAVTVALCLGTVTSTLPAHPVSAKAAGNGSFMINMQAKPPLKREGLLDALRYAQKNDLPTDYLLQEVRRRGVDFRITGIDENEFRAAGADNALLTAVRANYRAASPPPRESPESPPRNDPRSTRTLLLGEDTPIRLRLGRTISSKTERVGDKVDFDVIEDVKVNNIVVIPAGASASATVAEGTKKAGRFGRGGKLNVNIDYVRLASGEKVALRASKNTKGGGRGGVMTAGIVATSILFFPAAPVFLFIKGKDVTIPKGQETTAYVAGDVNLDPRTLRNQ